jgi:hypothetical protein
MVNPFEFSWLWRGLRGNSVTFALLFASCVVGLSLARYVKLGLEKLGVHWLYVLIVPVLFFGWLAKREPQWIPEERHRKWWARGLIAGSILLALVISWLRR